MNTMAIFVLATARESIESPLTAVSQSVPAADAMDGNPASARTSCSSCSVTGSTNSGRIGEADLCGCRGVVLTKFSRIITRAEV